MRVTFLKSLFSTALAFVLLIPVFPSAGTLEAKQMTVIYTDSSKHTLRTIAGLEFALKETITDCGVVTLYLANPDDAHARKVEETKPDLLITIGSTATAFADRNFPKLPVVFAKVLNPIESGFIQSWDRPGRHLTGASLDIPPDVQLQQFATMIPEIKKIGVVYTDNTRRLVEEARKAASGLKIEIIPYKLTTAKELPQAIDSLCRAAQGIWTVADEELSTPQFIRFTLLETLRNRIPVMGFNQTFVESGALFCLEADYKYVGRQAAEVAAQILRGADPATTKPTVPGIIYLYLNMKTSKLLDLYLPPELVKVAKETY